MTVKILSTEGSAIVGVDGKLRVVDAPREPCMSFRNGCVCSSCMDRVREGERKRRPCADTSKRCGCDRPMPGREGRCEKCGRVSLHAA